MTLVADVTLTAGEMQVEARLEAHDGQTIVVLGPNGAGKTSLLRAIAGLHALERGRVSIGDVILDEPETNVWLPPEQRPTAVAFQQGLLFPHLSVVDNVAFGLRSQGMAGAIARATALEWLEWVELEDRADATPSDLSGGEAQRVGLARALAVDAELLLLDEPFAALDVGARDRLRSRLAALLSERACTTVVVTHDPLDAMTLGDQLVVLEAGLVVQQGSPERVNRAPATPFVAQLVGLNVVSGLAAGHEVDLSSGLTLVTPEAHDGPATIAFAPHAVLLHRDHPTGSARNVWRATVAGLHEATDRVRVRLGEPLPCVAEITTSALRDLDLAVGEEVWASVKATELDVHPGRAAAEMHGPTPGQHGP